MPRSLETLVSFNAGEWSPTLTARVDQQKYKAACRQLRNMLCLKTGPATRRPGTQFIARAKYPYPFDYCVRLQDFQFSVTTKFILEFGQNYIRFYSNGAQVNVSNAPEWVSGNTYLAGAYTTDPTDGLIYYCNFTVVAGTTEPHDDPTNWVQSTILQVPTPYTATIPAEGLSGAEVFQLQFCAINDVVYICHPLHPRYKLTRLADDNWTMEPVKDMVPALLDQNATDVAIASSSTTGSTLLTASAPAWSTAFYYQVGAAVTQVGVIYVCVTAHVSGTFITDLGLGYWVVQTIFQVGHIGSYWELSNLRNSAYVEFTGTAAGGFSAGTSATITAFGAWEVHTYGVWSADIAVQSSSDGGITWQTVRSVTGRNDRNVDITGTAFIAQLYRIVVSNVTAPPSTGSTDPRVVFECVDAFLFGIVQITTVGIDGASAMVAGTTYQIYELGTTNWQDLGAGADFEVGTIFQYNGVAVTGTGGTCTTPYRAIADVITQLPVSDAWVSLQQYFAGDRVGYDGLNYVALNDVTSATDPATDTTNWGADGWPTIYWSEGAWSGVRGYPRAITAFGQRVWCGFTEYEPQRIWGTQVGDIENWDLGDQSLATDGMAFDLDAVGDGAILWLQAQDALFVGLVSAEWVVSSSDANLGITPSTVAGHRQSKWGSNPNIPARVVGDALVFVQRQGFSMRQMLFSIATNKYMSQDLTALSDAILNGGAIQLAYQQQGQKNGFLWSTTENGELVGMTYELDQEIFGWHRHITGDPADPDKFESVAVIPGTGDDDDEVWVVVKRATGGTENRFIERLNPVNWYQQDTVVTRGTPGYPASKDKAYYVDSGVTYVNPETNVFSGLDHLVGRDVAVCINAQFYGLYTVDVDGTVTVPGYEWDGVSFPPTVAQIGLPFSSLVQPMNLDVDVHTGATQGIQKQVTTLSLSLYDTLGCTVAPGTNSDGDPIKPQELNFRDPNALLTAPQLFTGYRQIKDFAGSIGLDVPILIYTDGPLPLTVLGVAIGYNLSGVP